jgi:monoamine oxidase
MKANYDVIIIGGGFAGVTAAREISNQGLETLVIEGKDRLGGRTWYDNRLGRSLEMGGTWVHWIQPHIWAEITRYGLETVETPAYEEAYWIADNKLEKGTPEELFNIMDQGMNKFAEEVRDYFPKPSEPLLKEEKLKEIDHLSVADKLAELNLSKREQDLVESIWSLYFCGPLANGGLTQAFRWQAVSNNDWRLCMEATIDFKLKNGTKSLIDCIASDIKGDILFEKIVSKVEKNEEGYLVTTKEGDTFFTKAVVVTVATNVLNNIEFKPALSKGKRAISDEKQTSQGVKVWAKVRNIAKPFMAMAPAQYPLNYVQYEFDQNGDGLLVAFGSDASKINIENKEEVEQALRHWIPDIEVIECTGHNWVDDELVRQTWSMRKTNQLTKYHAELGRPEGGIFVSGSDYGDLWGGFMDGGIESGYKVSNKIAHYLKEGKKQFVSK